MTELRKADEQDEGIDSEARGRLQRPFLLRDPEVPIRRARRRLYLATFFAGMLLVAGTVTVAQLVRERSATARGHVGWMQRDLSRLAITQSSFHDRYGRYGTLGELGPEFVPSQGVTIRLRADTTGWSASAIHTRSSVLCTVSAGIGPSVLVNIPSGEIRCR